MDIFAGKGVFFSDIIVDNYLSLDEGDENLEVGNNLSQLLKKQINYNFDTIINNIDNLSHFHIKNIFTKNFDLIIEIIGFKLDPVFTMNILKLIKKILENSNNNILNLLSNYEKNIEISFLPEMLIKLISKCLLPRINFEEKLYLNNFTLPFRYLLYFYYIENGLEVRNGSRGSG